MCAVLEVSPSGYYDWLERPESDRSRRHKRLVAKIRRIHQQSREIYGSPRIHDELIDNGIVVGKNTVAMLMQRQQIQSKVHKLFVVTTDSRHNLKPAENVLNRDFSADRPNQKWVSDTTFIPTREGWLFLATVMDLFSRKIVGWSMAKNNTTQLVSQALKMAIEQRGNVEGVILHSDRGIQYASRDYQQLLRQHGMICSMSRKGNCWDNAVMESFYHSLKTECVVFEDYHTRLQARSSLFDYIELFYNRQRRHSSLAYKSPDTYESMMSVH
jgi:transposase InsO family protein